MDKLFSRKRNRLIYYLIVYSPLVIPLLLSRVLNQSFQIEELSLIEAIAQYSFFVWYMVTMPISTLFGLLMLLTGWYKEVRKIKQDNAYRELAAVTILLNIIIIIALSSQNT